MRWSGGRVLVVVVIAVVIGGLVGATIDTLGARWGECGRVVGSCENSTQVVVATQNIDPYTRLKPLVEAGAFKTITVPNEALVEGAATSVDQLRGLETFAYLYENEQIPLGRLGKPCQPPEPPAVCIDACC